jgi:hypothetical protein
MDAPRAPHREMTDPSNRAILSNINPKLWACFQRSYARAEYLDFPEKKRRLEEALLMTAGLGGRGAELLRDALQGARTPSLCLAIQPAQNVVQDQRGPIHL